ncbi:MAG: hypothetical protein ACREK2_00820 [Gemmatimonadota bacterium]
MKDSAQLRVFVENAAAEPISEVELRIRGIDEPRHRKLTSGAQPGVFEISKIGPGSYELEVIPADKSLQSERYIFDATVELPLRLDPNEFTHLLVAMTPADKHGELRLSQRRGSGELSAGYSLAL